MVELCKLNHRHKIARLIEQCKNTRELKQIHGHTLTSSYLLEKDRCFLFTRLLFVFALSNSGSLNHAAAIFRLIKYPNLSAYNIMIRSYATNSTDSNYTELPRSLMLYKQMLWNNISPDCITFPFVLKECARIRCFRVGLSVHGQVMKFGLLDDVYVQNSLISFYSGYGFLRSGRNVFDEMSQRDVVSWNLMIIGYLRGGELDAALELFKRMGYRNIFTWNSMISGFVQGGRAKEALDIFHEMQVLEENVVKPDQITISTVLSACAHLGSIDHGRWVHNYLKRNGMECDLVTQTALVDMYGKCGCVEKAYEIFKEMTNRDTLAWTSMISVFALNGYAREAFYVFDEMEQKGVQPNQVTFVGLLSACAHSGLVDKGRTFFDLMRKSYLIEPQVYHYACMVDILSRAGLFEEAEQLIRTMPMQPDVFVWGALLGGCQMHGNLETGEKVAKYLIELEPSNHAFYMNLCDLYAKAARYDDVKKTRMLMKEQGTKKESPGCSMIEVDGIVREFSVGGSDEVLKEELKWVLDKLSHEMKTVVNMNYTDEIPIGVCS